MTVGPMVWALVLTRLWGMLAGTTDIEAIYPTRAACESDRKYWDFNSPEKRVYAECRAIHIVQEPTNGSQAP